jgi:aminoglycoside 2'-N-acetyltransferase I
MIHVTDVTDVVTVHTADLGADTRSAARALLNDAFEGDFNDHDWEHALGGMHALVWERGELTGHASLIQRRLLHGGRALRTGYVEGLAVRADRRGRGHASAMLTVLERLVREGYELGALSSPAAASPLYEAREWRHWEGPTSVLTPTGIARTPEDDGSVYVLPVSHPLMPTGELICDWRDGDVW